VTPQIIGALVRHAIGAFGAIGWVSDSEAEQMAGALALLVSLGWSIWQKRQAQKAKP
jgi:hypothetical protein